MISPNILNIWRTATIKVCGCWPHRYMICHSQRHKRHKGDTDILHCDRGLSLSLLPVYFWGAPGSLQRTPSWTYPTQPCSAHAPGGAHGSICHRRPLWNTLETSSDENIHWEKSQSDSFYEENSSKSTGVTWVLPASSGVLWWLVTWSQCNQYVKEAGTSTFLSPQLSSNSSKSCNTKILDDYGMVRDGFTVFYSVLIGVLYNFFQNA